MLFRKNTKAKNIKLAKKVFEPRWWAARLACHSLSPVLPAPGQQRHLPLVDSLVDRVTPQPVPDTVRTPLEHHPADQ